MHTSAANSVGRKDIQRASAAAESCRSFFRTTIAETPIPIKYNAIIGAKEDMYPPGNFFPARIEDVGFVAPNEGDFRLAHASPYRRAGTDGRDVGADIDSLNAAIAGVVRR